MIRKEDWDRIRPWVIYAVICCLLGLIIVKFDFIAAFLKKILKLFNKVELDGNTLVPIKLYFKGNKAKILLGLAKGKKTYDKRETIKQRDINREVQKQLKNY